jgi:hypothetical protein
MKPIRDHQRGKVYTWEQRAVAPYDRTEIDRVQAQAMVAAIWADLGLRYPPKVTPLPAQAKTLIGRADRLTIELADRLPSWCLLHELAHSLTSSVDGPGDGHGALFIATYMSLLARYLRLDESGLRQTARRAGLAVGPKIASFDGFLGAAPKHPLGG